MNARLLRSSEHLAETKIPQSPKAILVTGALYRLSILVLIKWQAHLYAAHFYSFRALYRTVPSEVG